MVSDALAREYGGSLPAEATSTPADTPVTPADTPVTPANTPAAEELPPPVSTAGPQPATPAASGLNSFNNVSLLAPGIAHRLLQSRCPSCFSLKDWGRPLSAFDSPLFPLSEGSDAKIFSGGDVQFGADGCFSYRHLRAAGTGPSLFNQDYFLTHEEVHRVQEAVILARKSPKPFRDSPIPSEIVDACGESWTAANENKQKGDPKRYDSTGIFALTCRHSQVLFMCDINTPGEQQHYIIALLEKVASYLPPNATIMQCYDGSRRIATLDEYVEFVNCEGITNLASWIERQRNKNIPQKSNQATKRINSAGVTISDLRGQWQAQLNAQISLRSSPPVRVQRDLGKIVGLQNQVEEIEDTLEQLQKTIGDRLSSQSAHEAIKDLQSTQVKLSHQAERLYTSLDLETHYPELAGLPFEFVQTLLLMRDLKLQIRKQAIGTFLEWENLDRAVQGRREPLGTKLHQAARKALSKRQPTLHRLIDKFNSLCSRLEEIQPPHCSVPIPVPLPTKLNELKSHTNLFEDIWISPSEGAVPLWLSDDRVREGITSLHVLDRCHEEELRLGRESENMLRWINQETSLISQALHNDESTFPQLMCMFFDTLCARFCAPTRASKTVRLSLTSFCKMAASTKNPTTTAPGRGAQAGY
ncbi:unnamed protein product [Mycena citricolor]|uniref:Uncharacterized protein n=1 Tax=Mycena citricolor TaxID=2018698 RepID=A0AAD2K5Q9_9AGAR|nr:unnamed protein product [Mycena citricolor]